MALTRLIYASRPVRFDLMTLASILFEARAANTRDGITGYLICRSDLFVQYLEGEQDMVATCYDRICNDTRHVEVTETLRGACGVRLFPGWAMRHDPTQTVPFPKISPAALAEMPHGDVLDAFQRISTEIA